MQLEISNFHRNFCKGPHNPSRFTGICVTDITLTSSLSNKTYFAVCICCHMLLTLPDTAQQLFMEGIALKLRAACWWCPGKHHESLATARRNDDVPWMLLGIRFRPGMHLFTSQRKSTSYAVGNGNAVAQPVSSAEQQEIATADILDKDAERGTLGWQRGAVLACVFVCLEQTRCNWLISGLSCGERSITPGDPTRAWRN